MLESVRTVGFLAKACVAVAVLGGIHFIISMVFDSTVIETSKYTNYKQSLELWNINLSTYRSNALELIKHYSNGTIQIDLNKIIYTSNSLEPCPETSPLLVGPMKVEFYKPVSLNDIRKENPDVGEGGRYRPNNCVAPQKVAIIIPFRNRDEHLVYWLHYLHPILQRQQLDYGIYIIQQDGEETFNRAKLLNVGYAEAIKEYDYECFIFSDVDIVPMDDRNIYKCFKQPRHLSVSMDKFGFRLPYKNYFGGVSAMSKHQFLRINGFPNNYWGWGGEDDDIFKRLTFRGMTISRPDGNIGKCKMIRHKRDKKNEPNPQRFKKMALARSSMNKDGINSLKYKVKNVEKDNLYTKITVDIGKP